ncbi:hypothetical protein HOG21_02300 [bacterium]|jgi:hypothetical protein|nr:hypothetical protein [bacterium]
MNKTESKEMTKFLLYVSLPIIAGEIYFWEEVVEHVSSIDIMNLIKGFGLYAIVKGLVVFGLFELTKVFIIDKLINRYQILTNFVRKIKLINIKISRTIKLKKRWKRYTWWEKIIIFVALLQVVIVILGAFLFYIPSSRKHVVKITQKKIGRKIFITILAVLPTYIVANYIFPKIEQYIYPLFARFKKEKT